MWIAKGFLLLDLRPDFRYIDRCDNGIMRPGVSSHSILNQNPWIKL
jgi:hypothetical protein